MISLGIPTLNRYDLLVRAIQSAEQGTVKPDRYFIVDNGGKFSLNEFYSSLGSRLQVVNYGKNLGVAGSWNKIVDSTEDIRIISNDDVEFFEDTIEILVKAFSDDKVYFPGGIPSANSFSCFVLPDAVFQRVGRFDEFISPNYAYFEDNDYSRRMTLLGIPLVGIPDCRLKHSGSSTLRQLDSKQMAEHHAKFALAEGRYKKKWGGLPGHEKNTIPFK